MEITRHQGYSHFTMEDLDRESNFPWDFSQIQNSCYFDISWIDKYPDKPWDFSTLHLASRFNINWIENYPDKGWHGKDILKSYDDLQQGLNEKQLEAIIVLPREEICRYMIVRKYIPNYQPYNIFPGVFYQIYQDIYLQDLSGDIFYLENWFTQNDVLEYAREQLPELGEFDIAVESQDGSEELLMASNTDAKTFKSHIFQNTDGPQGMIVYE